MKPSDQEIKCTVKSCKYNDKVKYCTLSEISVGESCCSAKTKAQTDCMSFELE